MHVCYGLCARTLCICVHECTHALCMQKREYVSNLCLYILYIHIYIHTYVYIYTHTYGILPANCAAIVSRASRLSSRNESIA